MDGSSLQHRPDRHPAPTYEEILERDPRGVPAYLREGRIPDVGVDPVATRRYHDPAFFRKEAEHLWTRVWQLACREEEIPDVGDHQLYEILDKSLIITRTAPGQIRAFYNSCLHRGRKLVTGGGSRQEFRCPFHGMSWNCDGSFKDNPFQWDFPQWADKDMSLPQAKVATWAGYVFVNFNLDAPPLEEVIAPLAADFERFNHADRYKSLHIHKSIRANWKTVAEAFMESHHSYTTHPQILMALGDANSQYDLPNDHISRHFSASGVASPFLGEVDEVEIVRAMTGGGGGSRRRNVPAIEGPIVLPEGCSARTFLADLARKGLSEQTGYDYEHACDAEVTDALLYNIFPNISIWGGYGPNLLYRWRPHGADPETAVMEIMIFSPIPKGQARPAPAPVQTLDFDEPFSSLPDIGALAIVFDQDMGNLPHIQQGLKASGSGLVHFGKYSEMRIRHMHHMIDRYIAEGEAMAGR